VASRAREYGVLMTVGLLHILLELLKREYPLMITVFNILAFLSFFGLVSAVFIAIERGMGIHISVILYERGVNGVTAYKQVSVM
jgi:hypothetical protein